MKAVPKVVNNDFSSSLYASHPDPFFVSFSEYRETIKVKLGVQAKIVIGLTITKIKFGKDNLKI